MMADSVTLAANIATLEAALARGVLRVRMPDQSEVQYADTRGIAYAIDRLRGELAAAGASGAPSALTFATWCRE